MTPTPETRTVYWWTLQQIDRSTQYAVDGRAGKHPGSRVYLSGGRPYVAVLEVGNHTAGAWLPDPPPPEEMSDEEIRGWAGTLRKLARDVKGMSELERVKVRRAATVIEVVLESASEWEAGCGTVETWRRVTRILRRRPGQ